MAKRGGHDKKNNEERRVMDLNEQMLILILLTIFFVVIVLESVSSLLLFPFVFSSAGLVVTDLVFFSVFTFLTVLAGCAICSRSIVIT